MIWVYYNIKLLSCKQWIFWFFACAVDAQTQLANFRGFLSIYFTFINNMLQWKQTCKHSIQYNYLSESWVIMPSKLWHWTLTSKYYSWTKKWAQEINITVAMFQKMRYNNLQDYAIFKIIFSGLIQVANPMHLDAVTSGCDRGGSTTS